MRRRREFVTAALASGALVVAVATAAPAPRFTIDRTWHLESTGDQIRVTHLVGDVYRMASSMGWEAIGLLDGNTYRGVFRYVDDADPPYAGALGDHRIAWTESLATVTSTFTGGLTGTADEVWRPGDGAQAARMPAPPSDHQRAVPDSLKLPPLDGGYVANDGARIRVTRMFGDVHRITSTRGWESVGIVTDRDYRGVFHYERDAARPADGLGRHVIAWSESTATMHATFETDSGEVVEQQSWRLVSPANVPPAPAPSPIGPAPHRPAYGDYVFVEELPEAVTKVPPVYPEDAREHGIDGTVLVSVLVLEDGHIGDTRLVRSVLPSLDAAAVAAAKQWIFHPALANGRPVAVWVAVPIRFTLH